MAINTFSPGVYVEEIPTLPASVAPVATAIPAFIGYTELDPFATITPTRITSLPEFESIFGGPFKEEFTITVTDTPPTNPTERVITAALTNSPSEFILYHSLQMYFANGGGPCWIVSVGDYSGSVTQTDFTDPNKGLEAIAKIDEPTLLLFPDAVSLAAASYGAVVTKALSQCNTLQDRFVVADLNEDDISSASVAAFRTAIGNNNLKYGAAYTPFLKTILNYGIDEAGSAVTHNGTPALPASLDLVAAANPGVYSQIIAKINEFTVTLPPSGSVAGIYASVDRDRGVWKAPANVSINGISAPTIAITSAEQDALNVDAGTGKSINAIRTFTGKGTLVWGARTFAGNDNEWRYVPVRRLFIMAEESIRKATEFVVFEPNDANTWKRVKGLINGFLNNLWRDGALAGATPDEAFFVKVGLGETMTAQDILEGKMYVQVGMAAVRPAEFVILNFFHKIQTS